MTTGENTINGDAIKIGLSNEIVTTGEVLSMAITADSLLKRDGFETRVNEVDATITHTFATVAVEDATYYARVAKYKTDPLFPGTETLPFILFDETPELRVRTPNTRAVQFTRIGSNISLITDNDLNPIVNDPAQAEVVKHILDEISVQVDRSEDEKVATRKRKREERIDNIVESIWDGTKKVGAFALCGAILAAGGYGIKRVDWSKIADGPGTPFDKQGLTLRGGTAVKVGHSGIPEFSTQLFDSEALASTEVPSIYEESSGTDAKPLHLTSGLREITIKSSKKGKNCESAPVDKVALNSEVVAWTDFTTPNGETRADELSVKYEVEKVTVCWHGQERNDQDDPRIVLDLRLQK